jgi:small neutral amino acid transporter SnatA (MarC family)
MSAINRNLDRASVLYVRLRAAYLVLFLLAVTVGSFLGKTVEEDFTTLVTGLRGGIVYGALGSVGVFALAAAVYQLYSETAGRMSRNAVYMINGLLSAFVAVLIGFVIRGLFRNSTAGFVVGGGIFLVLSGLMVYFTSEERLQRRRTSYLQEQNSIEPRDAFKAPVSVDTMFWPFAVGGLIGGGILSFGMKSISWESSDLVWLWTLLRSFSVVGAGMLLHSFCYWFATKMEDNDGPAQVYLSLVVATCIGAVSWLLFGGYVAPVGIGGFSLVCLLFSALKARNLLFTNPAADDQQGSMADANS